MIKTQTEPRDEADSLNKPKADMGLLFLWNLSGWLEFFMRVLGQDTLKLSCMDPIVQNCAKGIDVAQPLWP